MHLCWLPWPWIQGGASRKRWCPNLEFKYRHWTSSSVTLHHIFIFRFVCVHTHKHKHVMECAKVGRQFSKSREEEVGAILGAPGKYQGRDFGKSVGYWGTQCSEGLWRKNYSPKSLRASGRKHNTTQLEWERGPSRSRQAEWKGETKAGAMERGRGG